MGNSNSVTEPGEPVMNFETFVKLTVGPKEENAKDFLVHEGMLTLDSPFFKAALKKEWKEGQDGVIALPADDPVVVQLYLHLVHTGKVPLPKQYDLQGDHTVYGNMAKLYVFAEKMQNIKAKNIIIQGIIEVMSQLRHSNHTEFLPGPHAISIVYNGTLRGNPLRRLLTDIYAYHGCPKSFVEENEDDYPHGFLFDLARLLIHCSSISLDDPLIEQYQYIEMTDKEKAEAKTTEAEGGIPSQNI